MEIAQPSTNLNKTVKKIGAHSQNVNNTVKKIGAHSSIMGGCAPILLPKLSLTAAGNPASFRDLGMKAAFLLVARWGRIPQ
jgi:hypothetical protein